MPSLSVMIDAMDTMLVVTNPKHAMVMNGGDEKADLLISLAI